MLTRTPGPLPRMHDGDARSRYDEPGRQHGARRVPPNGHGGPRGREQPHGQRYDFGARAPALRIPRSLPQRGCAAEPLWLRNVRRGANTDANTGLATLCRALGRLQTTWMPPPWEAWWKPLRCCFKLPTAKWSRPSWAFSRSWWSSCLQSSLAATSPTLYVVALTGPRMHRSCRDDRLCSSPPPPPPAGRRPPPASQNTSGVVVCADMAVGVLTMWRAGTGQRSADVA